MNKEEKTTISVNEEDVQNIINAYEKDTEYINQLEKENEQLKDNWNKLKVYIKTEIPEDVFINTEWFVSILDKMQELEQGSGSNE